MSTRFNPIGGRDISDLRRREMLKGLAGLGGAALLPAWSSANAGTPVTGDSRRTALVIGAGIAGMSAAYELRQRGFNVTIFEKEDYTGGRMREAWMGPLYGFTHAAGVFKANREMFSLAADLGVAEDLDGSGESGMVDNGIGSYGVTTRFRIDEVGRVPGITDATRKRLPALEADLRRIEREVDPCLLATGIGFDDESLRDYYERVLGHEAAEQVLRYWVDPVLEWWGWPSHMTSKIALLSWYAQKDKDFVAPKGGIGVLTRKLATLLPVQTLTTVQNISPPDANGRHTVHYLTPTLERRSVTPDIVVCATEGKYIMRMVQGLSAPQQSFFQDIFTTKEAIIFYVLDDKIAPAKPVGGYHIPTHPDPIKRRINSWNAMPADPQNHNRPATLRIDLSRPEVPKWQVSGKTMTEYCAPFAKHFYPQFDMEHVTDIVNYTCDDLIYIPPGYVSKMAGVLAEQEKSKRGLYFAGEYVSGAHTGAACASGRSIARTIIRHWT